MTQQIKYKLGRGIFHVGANKQGMRNCFKCRKLLMMDERIDTESPKGHLQSYCFPCYREALDEYEQKAA